MNTCALNWNAFQALQLVAIQFHLQVCDKPRKSCPRCRAALMAQSAVPDVPGRLLDHIHLPYRDLQEVKHG